MTVATSSTVTVRGIDLSVSDLTPSGGDLTSGDDPVTGDDPVPGDRSSRVPFVWGHGLSSSRDDEDEFAIVETRELARTRRVVRYDAAGHGRSGDLPAPTRGAWSELAHDQLALVDELGLDEMVVGGASMGAATALHVAPLLGRRLRGLVLVIPPTGWATRRAQVDGYEQMARNLDRRTVEPIIAASAGVAPPDPFLDDAETYDARRAARLRSADPARLAAAFRGAAHADLPSEEEIARIAVPTLILAWSGDPGHPVSTAERLDELITDTQLHVASTADDLAGWTGLVATFLADVDRARLDDTG